MLTPGDPAPWFTAKSSVSPKFHFDTVAGRYIILCFFGSAAHPVSKRVLDDIYQNRHIFDDLNFSFFGVSIDPEDDQQKRVHSQIPGIRFFWDFDYQISRLYGAMTTTQGQENHFQPHSVLLDAALRTVAVLPFSDSPQTHILRLLEIIDSLASLATRSNQITAPVLIVPQIFEPAFCRTLIDLYEQHGGEESGFMRDVEGKTVGLIDYSHKRRMDYDILDDNIIKAAQFRLSRRLIPEIKKAFQFNPTRIERHIVARYDSTTGGYFRPHRDNTTKGTAHRRFAVTINLNAEEYEGGDLRFPEYGWRTYRASTGGAVVFSCSLLHEATPVTKGKRYAFLPFLYDDTAAKIRQMNQQFLYS